MSSKRSVIPLHALVFGEFCERDGPIARTLFVLNRGRGAPEEAGPERWSADLNDCLNELMMRSMSADHLCPQLSTIDTGSLSRYDVSELYLDHVRWAPHRREELFAHVTIVSLPDVLARGYQRTVCIAFVCNEEKKTLKCLQWISKECDLLARRLHAASVSQYRRDLARCDEALKRIQQKSVLRDERLSDRERSELPGLALSLENQAHLYLSPRLGTTGASITSSPSPQDSSERRRAQTLPSADESPIHSPPVVRDTKVAVIKDDEAVLLCRSLTTMKGTVVLRSLHTLCGSKYVAIKDMAKRMLWYFSLESTWMVEMMLQSMQPATSGLSHGSDRSTSTGVSQRHTSQTAGLPDARTPRQKPSRGRDGLIKHINHHQSSRSSVESTRGFVLRVGECDVIDPYMYAEPPAIPIVTDKRSFTAIDDPLLLAKMQHYGKTNIVNMAYNAMKGSPIIVCGADERVVLDLMKVCCLFVPGLLQSERDELRVGIIPFVRTPQYRLSGDELQRYAVIGCPVSAVMERGAPIFPQVCVLHVTHITETDPEYRKSRHTTVSTSTGNSNATSIADFLHLDKRTGEPSPSSSSAAKEKNAQNASAADGKGQGHHLHVTFYGDNYYEGGASLGIGSSLSSSIASTSSSAQDSDAALQQGALTALSSGMSGNGSVAGMFVGSNAIYNVTAAAISMGTQGVSNVRKGVAAALGTDLPTMADWQSATASTMTYGLSLAGMWKPWASGLLADLDELMSLRLSTAPEAHAYSNFARLTLKRIFFDICTSASLVVQSTVAFSDLAAEMHTRTDEHRLQHTSSALNSVSVTGPNACDDEVMSDTMEDLTIETLSPCEVTHILQRYHGYDMVYSKDSAMLSGLAKRMVALMADHQNRTSIMS